MNRQAWRDFFITVFFLGVAFLVALLSSVAADQRNTQLATIAAAVSLVLALLGALYIIPRLARNVRLEILRFAIRTTVTVEGLLFIVFLVIIGFAAWNTGNNLLYLILSAMLAFLIAANLIGRVSLAGVAVQLRFPDHIYAGESASISVTLLNHKRVLPSFSVLVEALSEPRDAAKDEAATRRRGDTGKDEAAMRRRGDAEKEGEDNHATTVAAPPRRRIAASFLPPALLEIGKLAYFVLVPAGASGRHRIERTFARRGRYPITGFRLATKFPAGFFKKWRRIDARGELIVYPKPQPLSDFYHSLPMLAGRIESRARGSGDDLYAIRRYQTSDHQRNIDWKATAKAQQMMVREHTREDEWRLTIVFDTLAPPDLVGLRTNEPDKKSQDDGPAEADEERQRLAAAFQEKFERAIVEAASFANHFILERAEVELITPDERYNVGSGAGYEQLYKILRVLATLQPTVYAAETEEIAEAAPAPRRLFKRRRAVAASGGEAATVPRPAGPISWRLLDELPVLGDERRFKVLITSAAKGTIPAHIWRSAHVVFMDDL